jgi:hypothetical protein
MQGRMQGPEVTTERDDGLIDERNKGITETWIVKGFSWARDAQVYMCYVG